MDTEKTVAEDQSKLYTQSINIEHALDTIRQFTDPNISKTIPTLESFDLQDGKLEVKIRSSIERTMRFTKDCLLQVLSPYVRSKQKEKRKAISQKLQESVDLLKIYSSAIKHMQKGSAHDAALADRFLQCIKNYNTLVQRTKETTFSLKNKIKRFFYSIAGWKVDDALLQSEIFLPETSEYVLQSKEVSESSLLGHKITIKNEPENKFIQLLQDAQAKSQGIPLEPKRQELDAFRLKAHTVLQHHETLTALSYKELVAYLLRYPIEAEPVSGDFGYGVTAVSLCQKLSEFPGETLEIRQVFQRDSFHPELCFPVKESFTIHTHAVQTGFPHPLQHIGFTLAEKLIPSFTSEPLKLSKLLEKKQTLSRKLLPKGDLSSIAKKLLRMKRKIFNSSASTLDLLKKTIAMLCKQAGSTDTQIIDDFFSWAQTSEFPFDAISHVHAEMIEKAVQEPLEHLQQEWLLRKNAQLHNPSFCKEMLNQKMTQAIESMKCSENGIVGQYQAFLAENLKNNIAAIVLLLFSEHLHFTPPTLSPFEKMLVASLFRSVLLFIYELEEYPQTLLTEENLLEHITGVLTEELALFSGQPLIDEHSQLAFVYAEEMINYFTKRTCS